MMMDKTKHIDNVHKRVHIKVEIKKMEIDSALYEAVKEEMRYTYMHTKEIAKQMRAYLRDFYTTHN